MASPAEGAPETAPPAEAPATNTAAAEATAPAGDGDKAGETKPVLTPEEKKKLRAERAEKRKEARIAARQAIKEAKARGEPVPPRPPRKPKAEKAEKAGDVETPAGAAPKISVAKLPPSMTNAQLAALFAPYGQVLRAEVSKRQGRPSNGTIVFNTNAEVRKAVQALHNKHKCEGQSDPITIQYTKDAVEWGDVVKKTNDEVADCLKQYEYKPSLLRSKGTKDLINRLLFMRKKAPETPILTAALLVAANSATPEDLVKCKLIDNAAPVLQLLKEDKDKASNIAKPAEVKAASAREEPSKPKIEKTFDAVIPRLDKLEKDRWNRMAKANLRLSERYRFRFVDILATPSLELWRWMVEDCDITPAEAGTCFAILQNHYGFSK